MGVKFSGFFQGDRLNILEGVWEVDQEVQLVGNIQLYYKDELTDQLGIRHSEIASYTDHQLILSAYRKWGLALLDNLYGSWSFVLYDKAKNLCVFSRDPTENNSLFYLSQNNVLFFSNCSIFFRDSSLFHLEIDAHEFMRLSMRLVGTSRGKTMVKGLFYVSPNEYIVFHAATEYSKHNYPSKNIEKLIYKNECDYFLQFRSFMAQAVACRLVNVKKPGIYLSSGLDSTTVGSFVVASLGKTQLFHTYTSVPFFVDEMDKIELVSEQPLVEYFLKNISNVKSSFLNFPDTSHLDQFSRMDELDLFFPIIHSNSFWLTGVMEQAKLDEVDTLFTGQMGNYSISFKGRKSSLWNSFKTLVEYLKSRLFGNDLFRKREWKYSIIRDELLMQFTKDSQYNNEFKLGYARCLSVASFRKKAFEKIHCFATTQWSACAMKHGVRVVDPTCDKRLLHFLQSIPSSIFFRKGISKYLLKQSMRHLIPERILWNRFPKPQSADIGKRLKKENFLPELVENIVAKYRDSVFFDMKKLEAVYANWNTTRSRQEQHVLSFHLLYMISMIKSYEGIQGGSDRG